MSLSRAVRHAFPSGLLALAVSAAPALAELGPLTTIASGSEGEQIVLTDMAASGPNLAFTMDRRPDGGERQVTVAWSISAGASWDSNPITGDSPRGSEVTICGERVVTSWVQADADSATVIRTAAVGLTPMSSGLRIWSSVGLARKPDVACVRGTEVALAWFRKTDDGWKVRLRVDSPMADALGPQTFDLGAGTPSRGLSVAATTDRVYVAWFAGDTFKVRRFSIGGAPNRTLTSLGTTVVASLPHGRSPEIGANGARVILAYSDRADLKVRRSTNRGASFGSAKTLRDEPFPSEIGAFPTTVAVRGERVAIGALEIGGIEELVGKGLGYKSTNGGASYTRLSSTSTGRILATLVRPASSWKYAELRDQSISQPDVQHIRFRREQ